MRWAMVMMTLGEVKMNVNSHGAPEVVELVYRVVGNTHVFHSRGIRGLVHIGSHDRKTAFDSVLVAVNEHVSGVYGDGVKYHSDMSYIDFSKKVDGDSGLIGSFITLHLDACLAA
jgi:hypothetical protein